MKMKRIIFPMLLNLNNIFIYTCAELLMRRSACTRMKSEMPENHVAADCGIYFINNLILGYRFCARRSQWKMETRTHGAASSCGRMNRRNMTMCMRTWAAPNHNRFSYTFFPSLCLAGSPSSSCRCRVERENLLSTFISRMDLCAWARYISKTEVNAYDRNATE